MVEVDHQNEDVPDEANGEQEYGVQAGEKQANDVKLIGVYAFFHIG